MRLSGRTYDDIAASFRWQIPDRFNIAEAVCDRHVGQNRTAIVAEDASGRTTSLTFEAVQDLSRRLANALAAKGIRRGDRIGILLPQCAEVLVSHLAAYRLGAIAIPLFTLFGPEALGYRLKDSGAAAVISDGPGIQKVLDLGETLHTVPLLVSLDDRGRGGVMSWTDLLERASPHHVTADTAADDPAMIIYTSGTTGNPKGALHAHRVLLGHLPGVQMPHDFFPQAGDRMWTPADWAWAGGLLDVLLPSLFYGIPVVAKRFAKFDPEEAFALLARHGIRNTFLPPTALKMMRQVAEPTRFGAGLRTVASGGERLGEEMLDWGRATFGLTMNEFYGQTEANLLVSNCATIMTSPPDAMGRAVPGHEIEILDPEGRPVQVGDAGIIGVRAPDPVMFLRYWNKPEATADKFRNGWLLTGDIGRRDAQGFVWFQGRDDDIINSGGYRIGPSEIEDCLMGHPAVAMVAVVGVPDPMRGEIVKAFVVTRPGEDRSEALAADMQSFVKTRLSAHEYPRQIVFRDDLPMTVTGKIRRKDLRDEHVSDATPNANGAGH